VPLSAVGCPLSPVGYQLSAISYQLPAISYQLSAISYPLSAISYPLSAISYGSRISNNRFLPVNVSPSMVVRPEDGERGGGGIAVATLKAESRKLKAES
jgi:hypothetical protein